MNPQFDPTLFESYLPPGVYERAYRGGIPQSDYLSRNRQIVPMSPSEFTEVMQEYRGASSSPNQTPVGPWQEGKSFKSLKELPRPVQRPPNFPLELLKQVPGSPAATGVGMGAVASNLIPILLMLQGSTDPDIARWKEERAMVTPPDKSRSVPDRMMEMPIAQMSPEVQKIQELADMIAKRGGRD